MVEKKIKTIIYKVSNVNCNFYYFPLWLPIKLKRNSSLKANSILHYHPQLTLPAIIAFTEVVSFHPSAELLNVSNDFSLLKCYTLSSMLSARFVVLYVKLIYQLSGIQFGFELLEKKAHF